MSDLRQRQEVIPEAWYGVWPSSCWLGLPLADTDAAAVAAVELQASRRDPHRQLNRVFHLFGRRSDRQVT